MTTDKVGVASAAHNFDGIDASNFWDKAPATPVASQPIEVTIVAKRCVYVNDHRGAGGKPYYSENLPSHTLMTTLGEVLDSFKPEAVMAAMAEKEARRSYFAAYHAQAALSRAKGPSHD